MVRSLDWLRCINLAGRQAERSIGLIVAALPGGMADGLDCLGFTG
jgi:hypothetical protein